MEHTALLRQKMFWKLQQKKNLNTYTLSLTLEKNLKIRYVCPEVLGRLLLKNLGIEKF